MEAILARGATGKPISDANSDPQGIAVIGADTSLGAWQFTLDGGVSWSNLGTPWRAPHDILPANSNTRYACCPRQTSAEHSLPPSPSAHGIKLQALLEPLLTSPRLVALLRSAVMSSPHALSSLPLTMLDQRGATPQGTRKNTAIAFSTNNRNAIRVTDTEANNVAGRS